MFISIRNYFITRLNVLWVSLNTYVLSLFHARLRNPLNKLEIALFLQLFPHRSS